MAGDRITDIINLFQPFIHATARGFAAKNGSSNLVDDMISEGNLAFMEAAGKIKASAPYNMDALRNLVKDSMKKYAQDEQERARMHFPYSTLPSSECRYDPSKQHIDGGLHHAPLDALVAYEEDEQGDSFHSNTRL